MSHTETSNHLTKSVTHLSGHSPVSLQLFQGFRLSIYSSSWSFSSLPPFPSFHKSSYLCFSSSSMLIHSEARHEPVRREVLKLKISSKYWLETLWTLKPTSYKLVSNLKLYLHNRLSKASRILLPTFFICLVWNSCLKWLISALQFLIQC